MDSYNYLNYVEYSLYAIVIIFIFWILLRELRNWYWKHNQMISLMEEISKKLTTLDNSINQQNNNATKIEVSPLENASINEEVIKKKLIEKKPKESIWTRKIF